MQLPQKLVTIAYWDCGCADHYHRDLDVAKRCEIRQRIAKRKQIARTERDIDDMMDSWMLGDTYASIGRYFAISPTRVGQIIRAEFRRRIWIPWSSPRTMPEAIETVRQLNRRSTELQKLHQLARVHDLSGLC